MVWVPYECVNPFYGTTDEVYIHFGKFGEIVFWGEKGLNWPLMGEKDFKHLRITKGRYF